MSVARRGAGDVFPAGGLKVSRRGEPLCSPYPPSLGDYRGLDKNITIQLDCMTQGTEKYPARIFFKFLLKKHKFLKISFLTNLRPYDMLYQINEVVYR